MAKPIVLEFSHVVSPDTQEGKGAAKFDELSGTYTNRAADVKIYPGSQLYED